MKKQLTILCLALSMLFVSGDIFADVGKDKVPKAEINIEKIVKSEVAVAGTETQIVSNVKSCETIVLKSEMSKEVKGIQVSIINDTSPIKASCNSSSKMKTVNKETKSTVQELPGINRCFIINPCLYKSLEI